MSRQDEINSLLINYNRRLQKLKEQKAIHGITVDPKVLIEIEDIEAEIENLQNELKKLENDLTPASDNISGTERILPDVENLSDDDIISGLLSLDTTLIKHVSDFISKISRTEHFQVQLLKMFNQPISSYQQRITIGKAFAFMGDPRNLEDMIIIPAGSFWLGADTQYIQSMIEQRYRYFSLDETPIQRISLPAFRIAKYPVTNQQYAKFLRAMPGHPPPSHWEKGKFPQELANHPVVNVSRYDAVAYARWKRKRLPSEFEWEKAAKGRTKRLYPWGSEFDNEKCNVQLKGIETTPVGAFPDGNSYYDVSDLAGNVWEWTNSFHLPYQGFVNTKETEEIFEQTHNVLRGGSYSNPRNAARCTCRLPGNPKEKYPNVGFRLAESVMS